MRPIAPIVERAGAALGHVGAWTLERAGAQVAPGRLAVDLDALDQATLPEAMGPFGLDRWRRAAAEILTRLQLGGQTGWRAEAVALESIDQVAPELGVLWEGLASWWQQPERGMEGLPSAAAWFVRWRRTASSLATEAPPFWAPTSEEWLTFGTWILHHGGPASTAPLSVVADAAVAGSWVAAAASFRRVRVSGGGAGARVWPEGADGPRIDVIGGPQTLLYGSLEGGPATVHSRPIGPVGTWTLLSGRTGQRFGASRGVDLTLGADGRGEVTLADAFVGPATEGALELASQYGVSGTLVGSWRTVGVSEAGTPAEIVMIELGSVRPMGVTVHPRKRYGFAIPAGPFLGRAEGWLARVGGTRWRIRPIEEGLEAESADLGAVVVLRFSRA